MRFAERFHFKQSQKVLFNSFENSSFNNNNNNKKCIQNQMEFICLCFFYFQRVEKPIHNGHLILVKMNWKMKEKNPKIINYYLTSMNHIKEVIHAQCFYSVHEKEISFMYISLQKNLVSTLIHSVPYQRKLKPFSFLIKGTSEKSYNLIMNGETYLNISQPEGRNI